MAAFGVGNAAEYLCDALKRRDRYVEVSAARSFTTVLQEAYRLEPRLIGCLEKWQGKSAGKGMLSFSKEYRIELFYDPNFPRDYKTVWQDDGKTTLSALFSSLSPLPTRVYLITADLNTFLKRVEDEMPQLQEKYSCMKNISYQYSTEAVCGYYQVVLQIEMLVTPEQFSLYETVTNRETEKICRQMMGSGNLPKLIRVYLAFSYLQLTCAFDHQMDSLLRAGQTQSLPRPWAAMAYGPIAKRMGVSTGIADAFKRFADFYGIDCRIIKGRLQSGEDHDWNMVSINNRYYHVDATYGVDGDGLNIHCFLKDDASMSETHMWDISAYPECNSSTFSFDDVETYIQDHESALLAMGVEEKLLFPEEILE